MQKIIPINQSEAVLFSNITSTMVFTRQIFQITTENSKRKNGRFVHKKFTISKFRPKIQ